MSKVLVFPIVIALSTGAVSLMLRKSVRAQRFISVLSTLLQTAVATWIFSLVHREGIQVLQLGGWEAPFGITLVGDYLSATMVLISALMGLVVSVYSLGDVTARRERFGYHALFHILLMGVYGAFLTGDLFNLYVWFEVMLIASFVLLSLGNEKMQIEGTVKYTVINLVSSLMLLTGVALIYGLTGTLNMADLSMKLPQVESPGLVTTASMLFLISFGVKAAVFPLFFWLPASYHTPPVSVTALFTALLTKVGVYTFIRTFTLLFIGDVGYTHTLILWISGLTMVTGVLGALHQNEMRKLLSFHIISQIGYMIMGLALFTTAGLLGAIFYTLHNIIVKTHLFLVSGVTKSIGGSFKLKELGGMYRHHPWLSIMFLIPAFSLAGFPLLSGFWAKFLLVYAGLQKGTTSAYIISGVAIFVGILTLTSMTKIWAAVFWSPAPENDRDISSVWTHLDGLQLTYLVAPMVLLAGLTLTIGIYPEPLYEVCHHAADQLMNPSGYREAVLPEGVPK